MRRQIVLQHVLVAAMLAAVLLLGVALRLGGPLSTEALGAEDPYTHVVFTKEWLAQGYFDDSFHLGTSMYPPGLHAFMGAFAPLAGLSLYEFARFAPVVFGGLAILGMYALGARLAGPVAGLSAALLTALIPEHIFRTELLFPTALDLALLPAWLLAFHFAMTDHPVAGSVLFLGASLPLAIMHPWVVPLFAAPLALYAALRTLRAGCGPSDSARRLARPAALLVAPVAFAMAFRWDDSDTGFADFMANVSGLAPLADAQLPAPLVFVVILLVLSLLAALGVALVAWATTLRLRRGARRGASLAAAAGLLALAFVLSRETPYEVDYAVMLSPLPIALGLAGLAIAFLRPSALGDMGVAIGVVLLPLTALEVFDSPYWPQRTVAYLAIGVALLGAATVSAAHEFALRLLRSTRARASAAPAALASVALLVAGAATAFPVDTYEWYRLYDEDEFQGFEEVVRILGDDPSMKVFIHTWQPALIVKTLGEPGQVWYSPSFFDDRFERAEKLGQVDGNAYVLIDKYTRKAENEGKADLDFVDDERFRLAYTSPGGDVKLYEVMW